MITDINVDYLESYMIYSRFYKKVVGFVIFYQFRSESVYDDK
jgi:hypothetical protein